MVSFIKVLILVSIYVFTCKCKERFNPLKPEMNHAVIEDDIFLWITKILDIVLTGIVYTQITIHIINTRNYNKNIKERRRSSRRQSIDLTSWKRSLNNQTWVYFIISFIFIILMTMNIWGLFGTQKSCDIMAHVMVTIFHFNKGLYYCILITRLHVGYGSSAYKYSIYIVNGLLLFVIIYTASIIFGSYFAIYGVLLHNPVIWCHLHIHNSISFEVGISSWVLIDLIITITLMILFIKPLKELLNDMENSKEFRFYGLMIKVVMLTIISCIFSMAAFLVYLFTHLTIGIEINIPIQLLCFSLMQIMYQETYNKLCGCCHNAIETRYISDDIRRKTKEGIGMTHVPQVSSQNDQTTTVDEMDNRAEVVNLMKHKEFAD